MFLTLTSRASKQKLLFLMAILALLLSSCERSGSKKEEKKILRINFRQDPLTLDPRKSGDMNTSSILQLIHEGLMAAKPDAMAGLGLADRVEISPDHKTYRFYLKESVWSDGLKITSSSFIDSWLEMLDPSFPCPNAQLLFPINLAEEAKKGLVSLDEVGIKKIDDSTFDVELHSPTPYFLQLLKLCIFSPIHESLKHDHDREQVPSSGPFKLISWKKNDEIILEKNEHYWNKASVTVDQIHISIIQNDMTAFQLYEQGELDFIGSPYTNIPPDCLPAVIDDIKTCSLPAATMCCFNLDKYPFNNKHIRRAFSLVLDREEVLAILCIKDRAYTGIISDSMKPNRNPNAYKNADIIAAKEELALGLAELNIQLEDLPNLTMIHSSAGQFPLIAQVLQDQWRKYLGITINLLSLEPGLFISHLMKKNFELGQCSWIAFYHDPMCVLERFKNRENNRNYPGFYNKEYETLLKAAGQTQDMSLRDDLLEKAETILLDEAPITCIYHWKNQYLQQPHIKNIQMNKDGTLCFQQVIIDQSNVIS